MLPLLHATRMRLATSVAALGLACAPVAATALLGGACSASNDDRKRAVKDVVAESVGHQAAMLGILEAHKDDRAQALALLDAYLQANGPSLDRIAHQRALLESDMAAMADAMKTYGAALGQNLERRQRLETDRPELMADPQVRAALARLDAL